LKKKLLFLFIIVAVGLGFLSWELTQKNTPVEQIQNILLISIDTCRADYLSCYGYPQKTTPNIDALAREGVTFENAISPVPITLPAHSSMLTGTNPIYHGVRDNNDYRLGEANVTLAEILKERAFKTGAIISAFVLDSRFGTNQGFEYYDDQLGREERTVGGIKERRGEEVSRLGIEWLKNFKDNKCFLFLHYFDPHHQYEPPEPFASEYASNLYAGEIAYTDYCIGLVLNKLKEMDLYESTLIIITSDHGEMLGEHGEINHAYFIYQSAIRVPLIFKIPGQNGSKVIKERVGIIDIVPTICKLQEIDVPSDVEGVDLLSDYKTIFKNQSRHLYCESLYPTKYNAASLQGLLSGQWKYIQTTRPELYNLFDDPAELTNLINKEPERVNFLQEQLKSILMKQNHGNSDDNKIELDEAALTKLHGLGYVGGSVDEKFDFARTKEDPKDLLNFHLLFEALTAYVVMEKFDKAERLSKQLISQRPDFWGTYYKLVKIYQSRGDINRTIHYLKETIKHKPDHYRAHEILAMTYHSQGKIDEAVNYYQKALGINPLLVESHNNLGSLLTSKGHFDRAVAHYHKALEINPDFSNVHNNLGNLFIYQGKADEAISHYREALQINPGFFEAHFSLGKVLTRQGNIDKAIYHLNEALKIKPHWPGVHYELGKIYQQKGKFDRTIIHWTEFVRLAPESIEVINNLAWILASQHDAKNQNSAKAIKLAKKACKLTNYLQPVTLDTLAAAYAAAGRFDLAEETAKSAIELAGNEKNEKLVYQINKRLQLYKKKQVYKALKFGNGKKPQ